ncbi:MAG: GNAT family N-acetyltransferase [Actinobacteria bacterium]|nr:GNAT family N-acetyltransferase [Actinomycetota bacterium]
MSETRETPVLRAGHVVLRPHVYADRDDIVAACRDETTWKWTTVPHPYGIQHADAYLNRTIGSELDDEWPRWAIEVDGRFGGNFGFQLNDGLANVGYFVSPWARNRGVGTLALWLACDWAFREGSCQVVTWEALVGNDESRRLVEKVGFRTHRDVSRKAVLQRGQRVDVWTADLLPEDLVPLKSLL